MGVAPTTELIKEPPAGGRVTKVGCAAQQQGISNSPLQKPMRPLYSTILMCDPAVVAALHHAIMGVQGFITQRPIGARVVFEVAESCRQTVTAMFTRGATQCPNCILQSFGQGHKALAAQHDMDMFEAAMGQPEVIKPMDQGLARDGDAQIGHVGEIRQAHAAGFLNLVENDLPLGPVQGPPVTDPALRVAGFPRQVPDGGAEPPREWPRIANLVRLPASARPRRQRGRPRDRAADDHAAPA